MAGRIRRYLTGFFEDDGGQPGLIERGDMPYLVKRDGSEVALESLGGGIPVTFTAGNGSPNGVVTSAAYGDLYCDTHNGALYVYVGDAAPSPWVIVSGDVDPSNVTDGGEPEGVGKSGTSQLRIVGAAGKSVLLTDRAGLAGTGNGLFWNDQNAADGSQRLVVVTGAGDKIVVLADTNGTLGAPPGGIKFPTADPHVVGAWWDNAGTLTKSLG